MDNMTRSQASRTRQKSKADARRIAENVPQHTKPAPKERSSLEKLGIVAGLIGSLAAVVAAVFAILGCQLGLDSRLTIELPWLPGCPGHIFLATEGRSTLPPTAHQ